MIRITVELVPYGIEKNKKTIAKGIITNDGTGNHVLGNYIYSISTIKDASTEIFDSGEIKGFRRLECSVWYLIYRMLMKTFTIDKKGKV